MKGKEKCDFLKGFRKKIADDNGIILQQSDCTHEGDCLGTCPLCDSESAYIINELKKKNCIHLLADGKYCRENLEIKINELSQIINYWQDSFNDKEQPSGDLSTEQHEELLPPPPPMGEITLDLEMGDFLTGDIPIPSEHIRTKTERGEDDLPLPPEINIII